IVVPLVARGSFLGAIALVASRSSPPYTPRDLGFVEQLALRAALSIDNARLFLAAQSAIRSRDEVLGVVVHDLRNPLSAITLHAELIRDSAPESFHASADKIASATARMSRLIEDLLDASRLESGRLALTRARISTTQLVADAADAQRDLAQAGMLELR